MKLSERLRRMIDDVQCTGAARELEAALDKVTAERDRARYVALYLADNSRAVHAGRFAEELGVWAASAKDPHE